MRTITLELLRHGPPQNQLLSPLTQYLALCGNHSAITVQVPFEHNALLYRLLALEYHQDDSSREFQLKDMGHKLGELLGSIPSLIAELNRDTHGKLRAGNSKSETERLTHLRLIISASELALLPFELALAPNGSPGEGQYLLMQSQEPICLTREVRRVPEQQVSWAKKPRILLAAAAPKERSIPLEAHVQALREVIDPWVDEYQTDDQRRKCVEEHLVVLPEVTALALQKACATGEFTHVHILAHGMQYREGYDIRYGLAFHDEFDSSKDDVLSGTRLATILRAFQQDDPSVPRANLSRKTGLACPIVVTLASCESAKVGTIGGAGASIAHSIHEAGIPLVIGAQFPLSFRGSVRMVKDLYHGLLWGEDPRILLSKLRRRLLLELPEGHDWATLATYASLPPRVQRELLCAHIAQSKRAFEVAMKSADRRTVTSPPLIEFSEKKMSKKEGEQEKTPDEWLSMLNSTKNRMGEAKDRLERLAAQSHRERAQLYSYLASAEKRCAEVHFTISYLRNGERQPIRCADAKDGLLRAHKHYLKSYEFDRYASWPVVQYLSLDLLLHPRTDSQDDQTANGLPDYRTLWTLAYVLSIEGLSPSQHIRLGDQSSSKAFRSYQRAIYWNLGNLVELELLPLLLPDDKRPKKPVPSEKAPVCLARRWASELVERAGPNAFQVYSTRRQMLRYVYWFPKMFSDHPYVKHLENAANKVLVELPYVEEDEVEPESD
jgi:hypothetical protein